MTDLGDDLRAARALIEARMANGQPFTYGELCKLFALHGGSEDDTRLCDKTIQRWRRRGRIAFERNARDVVWSLTDAGRAILASEQHNG